MDTGDGYMRRFIERGQAAQAEIDEILEKHPTGGGIFSVGETIWLRGSKFKVKQINPFGIRLKLLKRGTDGGDRCVCPQCGQSHDPMLQPGEESQ